VAENFSKVPFLLLIAANFLLAGKILPAQEVIISDSGLPYPFRGDLQYSVQCKQSALEIPENLAADSMTLTVAWPFLKAVFSGGFSDSFPGIVIWDGRSGDISLLNPADRSWCPLPITFEKDSVVEKRINQTREIAGLTCHLLTIRHVKSAVDEEYWFSDSLFVTHDSIDPGMAGIPPFLGPGKGMIPVEIRRKSGGAICTTRLAAWNQRAIGEEEFRIPEGYEEKLFTSRAGVLHPGTGR